MIAPWMPGDGRADVLRDRRDRDVHHRAVERHQELPRGEREQHDRRAARARRGRVRRRHCGHVGPRCEPAVVGGARGSLPDEVEDDGQHRRSQRSRRTSPARCATCRRRRRRARSRSPRAPRSDDQRLAPVSALSRYAANPTRRKITREQALPTEAIAERSTRFATTRTIPAVMSSPACVPSREPRPKNGGNCPSARASTSTHPRRRAWR